MAKRIRTGSLLLLDFVDDAEEEKEDRDADSVDMISLLLEETEDVVDTAASYRSVESDNPWYLTNKAI